MGENLLLEKSIEKIVFTSWAEENIKMVSPTSSKNGLELLQAEKDSLHKLEQP